MTAVAPARVRAALEGSGEVRVDTTLLELVWAIGEVTEDEREVIAAVVALIQSGRVRLRGAFRDKPLSVLR